MRLPSAGKTGWARGKCAALRGQCLNTRRSVFQYFNSMRVPHTAMLTQGQTLASGLQFFLASAVPTARLQALRGLLMGAGHGAVAFNIFLVMTAHRSGLSGFGKFSVAVLVVMPAVSMGRSGKNNGRQCGNPGFHSGFLKIFTKRQQGNDPVA